MSNKFHNLQNMIDECNSPMVTESRLLELLFDSRMMVRANAVLSLSKRPIVNDEGVVDAMVSIAHSETASRRVIGTMNEKMLILFGLAKIDSALARKHYEIIRKELTATEQSDLDWFIKNTEFENLSPPRDE